MMTMAADLPSNDNNTVDACENSAEVGDGEGDNVIVQTRLRFFTNIWEDDDDGDSQDGALGLGEKVAHKAEQQRLKGEKSLCKRSCLYFSVWIKSPINKLVLAWLLCVIVSGALLFMVLVGMITFSSEHTKGMWDEVTSQILNGLFTLKAIAVQPARAFGLYQLVTAKSAHTMRTHERGNSASADLAPAAKKGSFSAQVRKSNASTASASAAVKRLGRGLNRSEAIVFFLLLNINCWAQYVMAGFMWGYQNELLGGTRPMIAIALALPISFFAEIAASVWQHFRAKRRRKQRSAKTPVVNNHV